MGRRPEPQQGVQFFMHVQALGNNFFTKRPVYSIEQKYNAVGGKRFDARFPGRHHNGILFGHKILQLVRAVFMAALDFLQLGIFLTRFLGILGLT
jgi:hypothetical protein